MGRSIRPNGEKKKAIRDAIRPTTKNKKVIHRESGIYRKFIPNFSFIAYPLTDLKKKDRPNNIKDWQDHYEKAFQTLKNRLTSSPVLRLPIFQNGVPFILRTDASDTGIGAALLQEFEGEGKIPIAYAKSKRLSREENYSVIVKVCISINPRIMR